MIISFIILNNATAFYYSAHSTLYKHKRTISETKNAMNLHIKIKNFLSRLNCEHDQSHYTVQNP